MIIAYDKKKNPKNPKQTKNLTNKQTKINKKNQINPASFSKRQMKLCKVPEEPLFNFSAYQWV